MLSMSKLLKQKIIVDETQFPLSETRDTASNTSEATVTKGGVAMAVSDDEIEKIAEKVVDKKVEEKLKEKLAERDLEKKVESKVEEEKLTTAKKVQAIVENPSRNLYDIKAVFPFDLFPDEVHIEETKVNFITRNFFASQQVLSMSFKDIKKVEVQTSIIFAKLHITSWTAVDNIMEVSFLKKHEALKARRIIEGLKLMHEQKVDFSKISTQDLLEKVEHLGSVK